jgi:hypothetical protein
MLDVGRFLLLPGGEIRCRDIQRSAHNACFRGGKINIRVTLPAPGAASGLENLGRFLHESALLLWRDLHHASVFIGDTQ